MSALFVHPQGALPADKSIAFYRQNGGIRVVISPRNMELGLRFDIPQERMTELMNAVIGVVMGDRFCVDGTMEDGTTLQGDAQNAPFKIFDILKQRHINTIYQTRVHAEAVCRVLNGD